MSRHNRRRSRGGRKHAPPSRTSTLIMSDDGLATNPSLWSSSGSDIDYPRTPSPTSVPDIVDRVPQLPANMPLPRSSAPSARVWHNRYIAWQARKQSEEQLMEDERKRLFSAVGPEAGRGVGICSPPPGLGFEDEEPELSDDEAEELEAKMMDYFRGLDWLV